MQQPLHDMQSRRPLLVFSDDWGRHPSSSQHLIRRLLTQRPVVWVNSIGTRPPRLDLRTAQRVIEKLGHWTAPGRRSMSHDQSEPQNGADVSLAPRVISPRMWPSFAKPWMRRVNRHLLASALRPVIAELPEPPIAITTLPIVADLIDALPVHRWVYYCVDDFSQWPGYDGATMQAMERDMIPRMDSVIAASQSLVETMASRGVEATLLTHGVDLRHWQAADSPPGKGPLQIVFWGVIDRRMDIDWVAALDVALERERIDARIVLVGPREDPDPRLWTLPRVIHQAAVPYDALPALAASAAVLVMPYADLPATRAMQPLKLNEYLASGKPAVVRDLPATRAWRAACDLCDSAETFATRVVERLRSGLPLEQRAARTDLDYEGWDAKASTFDSLISLDRAASTDSRQKCVAA
jgi:glycosyltransferase involved in cell wall biosynthesis